MKKILFLLIFSITLNAKVVTPNEVYTLSVEIQNHMHFLLDYYGVKHNHEAILKRDKIVSTRLKPRNIWQKAYEILVKINMLRSNYNLPRVEPVSLEPMKDMKPDMVYEMNLRILTELKIFELSQGIEAPKFESKIYTKKMPIDNYNIYVDISASLDELNKNFLTPNYVFAEAMRIHEEVSDILNYLNIRDDSLPDKILEHAIPKQPILLAFKFLDEVALLQLGIGLETTDFSEFNRKEVKPGDVFTVVSLIISELQTIKAYIGMNKYITPPAKSYNRKKPRNVEQLMKWNLKKIKLIKKLDRR